MIFMSKISNDKNIPLVQPADPSPPFTKLYFDLSRGKNIPNVRLIAKEALKVLGSLAVVVTGIWVLPWGLKHAIAVLVTAPIATFIFVRTIGHPESEIIHSLRRKIAYVALPYLIGLEREVNCQGASKATLEKWLFTIKNIALFTSISAGPLKGSILVETSNLATEYRSWADSVLRKMRMEYDRNPAAPVA